MPMHAHEKLRFWRIVRGLTQSDLGSIMGCNKYQISVFERGKWQMRKNSRKCLALALNIPEEALTDEAPDPIIITIPTADTLIREDGVQYITPNAFHAKE